jgi:hypothetical protein
MKVQRISLEGVSITEALMAVCSFYSSYSPLLKIIVLEFLSFVALGEAHFCSLGYGHQCFIEQIR